MHWAITTCQLTLDNESMKLSRKVTGLLSVALLAFMVTPAMAQQRGQGGQGGRGGAGGGGFGSRGGGGSMFGGRGGGDMTQTLLRIEAIRTELEISPDQEEALTKMQEQGRTERPSADFRNMSEEERTEFFTKMRKQAEERNAKMKEQLEEVLFPEQLERLQEINIQLQGIAALRNEDVAKELKITEAQKKELEEVQAGMMEKMREGMRELFTSGGGREGMREKIEKMRKDMEGDVLGVLTSDQKKKFEEMKGEKFEMPEGAFGRGGQGGQGGRGGFGGRGGGEQGGRGGRGGGEQGGRGGRGGGEQGGRGGRGGGEQGGRGGGERQRPEVE